MNNIKEIVKYYEIEEKRERVFHNNLLILQIKKMMSDLSLYHNVSRYIYDLDKIKYCDEFEKSMLLNEIDFLKKDEHVIIYIELKKHIDRLEEEIKEYYKTIQVDLRRELISLNTPDIFVNQDYIDDKKDMKFARHIISPSSLLVYDDDYSETMISSYKDLKSKRSKRHFYNQVSFRYLEELSKDYNYDLDGKYLGNVKILKK